MEWCNEESIGLRRKMIANIKNRFSSEIANKLRQEEFYIEFLERDLRGRAGNVVTDDFGFIITEKSTMPFRGSIKPVGRADVSFGSDIETIVDDIIVKFYNPEQKVVLRMEYNGDMYNIIGQVEYENIDILIARKEVTRDSQLMDRVKPPWYEYNKKIEERLGVPVIADGQNIRSIHPPFIVFEEGNTDWLQRHQTTSTDRSFVYVNYTCFERRNAKTSLVSDFKKMFYDEVFWDDMTLFKVGDITRAIEERNSAEYWELHTIQMAYFYSEKFENEYERLEGVDYEVIYE